MILSDIALFIKNRRKNVGRSQNKEKTAIAQGHLEIEFDYPHSQKLKEAVILCCNIAGYAVEVVNYLGGTFLLKLTWEKKGENRQAA